MTLRYPKKTLAGGRFTLVNILFHLVWFYSCLSSRSAGCLRLLKERSRLYCWWCLPHTLAEGRSRHECKHDGHSQSWYVSDSEWLYHADGSPLHLLPSAWKLVYVLRGWAERSLLQTVSVMSSSVLCFISLTIVGSMSLNVESMHKISSALTKSGRHFSLGSLGRLKTKAASLTKKWCRTYLHSLSKSWWW